MFLEETVLTQYCLGDYSTWPAGNYQSNTIVALFLKRRIPSMTSLKSVRNHWHLFQQRKTTRARLQTRVRCGEHCHYSYANICVKRASHIFPCAHAIRKSKVTSFPPFTIEMNLNSRFLAEPLLYHRKRLAYTQSDGKSSSIYNHCSRKYFSRVY